MTAGRQFGELLARIAREVTSRQASEVCCGDFTLEQFRTLQSVGSTPQTIGSLSAALRVDLSTMSRNVSVLERNGYLRRSRSAEDGRVVNVDISAKGRRALDTLCCDERDVLGEIYHRLPAAERARVTQSLEVLRTCLESPAPDAACCTPARLRKSAG
jgi:DNA-binding MarR family transcriptional regulator